MKLIRLLLAPLLLYSCSSTPEDSLNFQQMRGKWKMDGQSVFEQWTESEAAILEGVSYVTNEEGFQFIEFMTIEQPDTCEDYYLKAVVVEKDSDTPTFFKLSHFSENTLGFSNPQHDYPQNIIYKFESDSTLLITISGDESSEEVLLEMELIEKL